MADKDLYQILGIDKNASAEDIKKAYRRMAAKYHPDRNPGDPSAEAHFKEAKKAYDILSDEQKRATYDRYGFDAASGQQGFGGSGFNGNFSDIFGDVFGDIFGGGGRQGSGRQHNRGRDLAYELELSLEEAVQGCDKEIRIPTQLACDACGGNGMGPKSKKRSCPTCQGQGQVRLQQGFFSIAQTCPNCKGAGQLIDNPCEKCHGEGRLRSQKKQPITIPAGVDNGDRIRFAGEGEAGRNGAAAGDLFIEVRVRKHEVFAREGDDLHCSIPISFVTACLGGEIEVPTLTGRVKLSIPPETQTGKTFRLRGKGVKSVRSHAEGDLYCTVNIETPVKLSSAQKELLQQFAATLDEGGDRHHAPKEKGFFENVKNFFDQL